MFSGSGKSLVLGYDGKGYRVNKSCRGGLMKSFWIGVIVVFLGSSLIAQEPQITDTLTIQGFYALDNNEGWGQTGGFIPLSYSPVLKDTGSLTAPDTGRNLGSGWGGVGLEAVLTRNIRFPFLTGEGALFQGNNITYNLRAGLAPVALRLEAEAVLTPIAFLQFGLGAQLGTGWDLVVFNGLGLNTNPTGEIEKTPFGGAVVRVWAFGVFQFDLAALIPGEWNHVVVLSRGSLAYQHFTRAGSNEAWQWAADEGKNFNGPKLVSVHFLGYQMPLVLNTVGLLLETEVYLDPIFSLSRWNDGGWGSDFLSLRPSFLTNWTLAENQSLAVLVSFSNFIDYSDATIFNRYYLHRSAEAVGWKWDKINFQWNMKF